MLRGAQASLRLGPRTLAQIHCTPQMLCQMRRGGLRRGAHIANEVEKDERQEVVANGELHTFPGTQCFL